MNFCKSFHPAAVAAFGLAALLCAAPVGAKDLGRVGPTYPIAEPDLLEEIQVLLEHKEASGELARLQEEAQKRAVARIQSPAPVAGLTRTTKARTHYFDPTVIVDENITDGRGNVIVAAGTRSNPLDTVTMTRQMLFFDGRDPDQVRLARAKLDELGGRLKPVLVAGSYMDLMKSWQVPVFYDQDGALVRKLGISQVPALVAQEGKRLRVDEMVPPPPSGAPVAQRAAP